MRKITQFAVAHPWLCDVIGHLNTRHYHGMFDDTLFVLLDELGYPAATAHGSGVAFVDVRNELEYRAEVVSGAVVRIQAYIEKIGTKSITAFFSMTTLDGAKIHATMRAVLVSSNVIAKKAIEVPADARSRARVFLHESDST